MSAGSGGNSSNILHRKLSKTFSNTSDFDDLAALGIGAGGSGSRGGSTAAGAAAGTSAGPRTEATDAGESMDQAQRKLYGPLEDGQPRFGELSGKVLLEKLFDTYLVAVREQHKKHQQ